jgi:hypothetical protein
MEQNYLLPATLANNILAYLGQKPYVEVADLIFALQGIAPAPEVDEAPEEVEKMPETQE